MYKNYVLDDSIFVNKIKEVLNFLYFFTFSTDKDDD